ncbi:MAG: acetoin utilization protein AcuC [Pseudoruegeria sp.]
MTKPIFIGSEIFRTSTYGAYHPLRVPRVSTVMDLSRALGWLPSDQYRISPRAKPSALALWHGSEYLAALQRVEVTGIATTDDRQRFGLGTPSNPVFAEMFRRPATGAGGSMLGAELLRNGGVVYNPAGGTHHGLPDRANGFCYLNDPVLAILMMQNYGLERIAYIDIDAHHCDGVEYAFASDPSVLCLSVHEENRWPFAGNLEDAGVGNVFNVPVPKGFNDTEMRAVLSDLIMPVVDGFKPDAIVLQCGADALTEDPLARLTLSNGAHRSVVAALNGMSPRYLVLGGGGYNPWSVGRCWTGVWAQLNKCALPERLPQKAEDILRAISWSGHRLSCNPSETLFTTLLDSPREGPVRPEIRIRISALRRRQRAVW